MASRFAWGWIGVSAVAGALVALGTIAGLMLGSGARWSDIAQLGTAGAVATILCAGAAAGAALALPGALPGRIFHPSIGLWLMVVFGNVDWLRALDGATKAAAQSALLVAIIVAAAALRRADARLGRVAAAVVAGLALSPVVALTWTDVTRAANTQWWFEEEGLGETLLAQAREASRPAGGHPDIYLVVPDQYPSPAEAERRGHPYPAEALARLRARGWRIRDEAFTPAPRTAVTLAATLALTTTVTDGANVETAPEMLKALFEADRLAWRRSFADPLLLEVLANAGYETQGWIGWWLMTERLDFDRVDRLRESVTGGSLGRAVAVTWRWQHLDWLRTRHEENERRTGLSRWTRCHEVVSQRERFFATDREEREPGRAWFALYHVYWLHDAVAMDATGACENPGGEVVGTGPHGLSEAVLAGCRRNGGESADGTPTTSKCIADAVRAKRTAAMMAYLPAFLERLEAHARRNSSGGGFRILVLSDEGMADRLTDLADDADGWTDGYERKHPAVLRATFAEGVPELWDERAIPDMPQAMRAVVEALLDGATREAPALRTPP